MPFPIHCGTCNAPLFFRLAYRNVGLTVPPHDMVLGSDRGPKEDPDGEIENSEKTHFFIVAESATSGLAKSQPLPLVDS